MNQGRQRNAGSGSQRILKDAPLSAEEMAALDMLELRKVRIHLVLLAFVAILDLLVAVFGAAKVNWQDAFSLKHFDLTKNLADIVWLVLIRSCVVAGAILYAGVLPGAIFVIKFSFWVVYAALVYAAGKLVAFNWGSLSTTKTFVGILPWIAFGAAELVLFSNLQHWLKERELWVQREISAEGSLEDGSNTSLLGNAQRVKQEVWLSEETKKGEEKKLSTWGMFKVLKPYFSPKGILNKLRCALTFVFLGLSKTCNLLSPIFIGRAVQELSDPGSTESDVFTNILIYCGLSLASPALKEMQNVVYLRVKQIAYVEIAEETFTHLHSLSLEWHLKKKMGNVLRSMDRGVSAANTLVTYLFLYLLPSLAECVVVFVIFYSHFDIPTVSATAFMSFVAYATVTVQITLWRKKFREKTNQHDNDYHDKATDSLINYETVKYFTAERFEIERYTKSIYNYQKYSVNTAYSLSFLNTTQNFIIQFCTAISLCMAAHEVLMGSGQLKVGNFVSIASYISNLFAPLSFLGSIYNAVIQSLVDIQNLSELLAEEPDVVDDPNASVLDPVPKGTQGASVEFRKVKFNYPTQVDSQGLRDVSFSIEPGSTTAIVGATGSGKSTIARLLFRFYDPLEGQIFVSGQDIKKVTQLSLRQSIGVVPQDTVLFNDTIMHNVAYGNPGASEEDIIRACKHAHIYDFILSLPEGFKSMVGERGLKLSGGEKQRVSIARCLLKNPPIVILDEATSALDNVTERSVQAALHDLTVARTTLVIAHRLTTIAKSEQIIVLDKGRMLERGTHAELLAKRGAYTTLWQSRDKD